LDGRRRLLAAVNPGCGENDAGRTGGGRRLLDSSHRRQPNATTGTRARRPRVRTTPRSAVYTRHRGWAHKSVVDTGWGAAVVWRSDRSSPPPIVAIPNSVVAVEPRTTT